MQKVVITGVNGFVGRHVATELKKQNFSVIGTGTDINLDPVLAPYVDEYTGGCNLTKEQDVYRINLDGVIAVINLAGLSNVGSSFKKIDEYMNVNVNVHLTFAKRMQKEKLTIRMVSISSGAVYDALQVMPITESSPVITMGSPYALSKIAMENAMDTFQNNGLDIVIVRPFNHTGPGQLPGFLVPDLYDQIQLALHNKTPLKIGNLETKRDYTDVRDVARAYVKLATAKKEMLSSNVYNVCSGRSMAGTQIFELLAKACDARHLQTEVDLKKIRPNDPKDIYGSYSKLNSDLKWSPVIPIEKTISDFVETKKKLHTVG